MRTITKVKCIRIHLINIYVPDKAKTNEEKDKVLKLTEFIISQKILSANYHEYLLIGGDFNKELRYTKLWFANMESLQFYPKVQ